MKRTGGWFIALEGGEGAGKSTQAENLLKRLLEIGVPAISVHEPGTTPLGLHLRTYLKGKQRIDTGAELLLFGASRSQLMTEVIQPNLKRGISVIADRFAASSIAYQGHGRGIAVDRVQAINDFATGGVYPDLNILLDLPPEAGLARTRGETQLQENTADNRRFEDQPMEFHRRVRQGFLLQVSAELERWTMIDARMEPEQVHEAIWEKVRDMMGIKPRRSWEIKPGRKTISKEGEQSSS